MATLVLMISYKISTAFSLRWGPGPCLLIFLNFQVLRQRHLVRDHRKGRHYRTQFVSTQIVTNLGSLKETWKVMQDPSPPNQLQIGSPMVQYSLTMTFWKGKVYHVVLEVCDWLF